MSLTIPQRCAYFIANVTYLDYSESTKRWYGHFFDRSLIRIRFRETYFGSALLLFGNSNYNLTKHDRDRTTLHFWRKDESVEGTNARFYFICIKKLQNWKCKICSEIGSLTLRYAFIHSKDDMKHCKITCCWDAMWCNVIMDTHLDEEVLPPSPRKQPTNEARQASHQKQRESGPVHDVGANTYVKRKNRL